MTATNYNRDEPILNEKGELNMTEKERYFLEDTRDILVHYDGCHTEPRRLVDLSSCKGA